VKGKRAQLVGGGSKDGTVVKDVYQDEILAPCESVGASGIKRLEVYRRGADGDFHFAGERMMTPDEEVRS
jgi:hypothetical protein